MESVIAPTYRSVARPLAGTVVDMPDETTAALIDAHLRTVRDFPHEGILFRDVTTVYADGPTFAAVVDAFAANDWGQVDGVLGIEARGFGIAAAMAYARGVGMVSVRKAGKLPGDVLSEDYELEYGTATLQVQPDALPAGSRVVILDDLLATGGTLAAVVRLAERAGWIVAGIGVVIALDDLGGRAALPGHTVFELSSYPAS
jgi:adenine phosphoribosyltransferase